MGRLGPESNPARLIADYSLTTDGLSTATVRSMLGNEIRKAREVAGISQEALAFRAGVHRTYVSLLERNKKSPTLDTLFRLCDALGIKASTLLARVEKSRRGTRRR